MAYTLPVAFSLIFRAQVTGDSLLGMCVDTSDQIIHIPVTQQGWACCRQGTWTKSGGFCDHFLWILHARFWLDSRAESRNLYLVSALRDIHCHQRWPDSREEKKSRFTYKRDEIQVKGRKERERVPRRGKDSWVPIGIRSWQTAWIGSMGWGAGLGLT